MVYSSQTAQLTQRLLRSYRDSPDAVLQAGKRPIPSLLEVRDMVEDLRELLFPGLTDGRESAPVDVGVRVNTQVSHLAVRLTRQISLALRCSREGEDEGRSDAAAWSERAAWALLDALPTVRATLLQDADAALAGDPAAHSIAEVVLCYPGYYAITVHRLAHELLRFGVPLLPRMMAEHAHRATGVDIHPGAHIGPGLFIDHGTGVVIGETAVIGTGVRLYQGVTLGALSLPANKVAELRAGAKRHPTLEDEVVVYAGATILGGQTVVGRGSVIGGSAWVIESVPPGSRVFVETNTKIKLGPRPSANHPKSPTLATKGLHR